jgi:hypothetical protein
MGATLDSVDDMAGEFIGAPRNLYTHSIYAVSDLRRKPLSAIFLLESRGFCSI